MPRGKSIDTKDMSPEEYEKKFGRRKPGPKLGAAKKVVAKAIRAAKPGLKKDGSPRKKPGPKPGKKPAVVRAKVQASGDAPWGYKKDGTPRKPPGRKGAGTPIKKTEIATAGRRGLRPSTKSGGRANAADKGAAGAGGDRSQAGKDLGPPPPSRAKQFQLVRGIVIEELDEVQLKDLHEAIEEKLIGDVGDFDKNDWDAVADLESGGFSKLSAVNNVRKDKLKVAQADAAITSEAKEEEAEAEEEEQAVAAPGEDDVEEEEESTNTEVPAPPQAAVPPSGTL